MRSLSLLTTAALVAGTAVASAQSLADVARREEARRKAVTTPGRVYTNDSLQPDRVSPEPAPAVPAASAAPAGAAPESTTPAAAPAEDANKLDEAAWRRRVAAERDALDRARTFADALQSRINALSADFTARDDPFQRNQIAADRQKALAELDRVRKEIAGHTKAITDIQEEARKAGVPAGWVR